MGHGGHPVTGKSTIRGWTRRREAGRRGQRAYGEPPNGAGLVVRWLVLVCMLLALVLAAGGCRTPEEATPVAQASPPALATTTSVIPTASGEAYTATPAVPTATRAERVPTSLPQPATPPPTTAVEAPTQAAPQTTDTVPVPATPAPSQPLPGAFGFAVLIAVPEDRANAANVDQIRAELKRLKELGLNIVVQSFQVGSTEADWKAFFDIAAEEGLGVIPAFRTEPPVWTGSGFDLGSGPQLLAAMKDHPALYAYFLVDEPFHEKHDWQITADRLQMLYQQFKAIAPRVPMMVQFSREIKLIEEKKKPQYEFRSGMCDICVISALEFRNYGEGDRFYSDELVSNHIVSRAVIKRENPGAQIWSTIQVFGTATGKSTYYMPSAQELGQMTDVLFSPELQEAGELDGVIWQLWASPRTDQDSGQLSLADPEADAQRQKIKEIARTLGLLP